MAVGSSGGHIYPALAVAEKLKSLLLAQKSQTPSAQMASLDIHLAHSGSPLGKQILSSAKYPVHEIPLGGLAKGQSAFQKIKTLLSIPRAFFQSFFLIKKLKPQVIFGTGGAVSGPVLMAGWLLGRKTAIWEGNAVMGLANKWLSPFVSSVFTVFPQVEGLAKKQAVCAYPLRQKTHRSGKESFLKKTDSNKHTGREDGQRSNERAERKKKELLSQNADPPAAAQYMFKVLILGGSQGSVLLNRIVSQAVEESQWRKSVFIFHQTGEKHFHAVQEKYQSLSGVRAFPFSPNIEEYYQTSDLVFSRAGSGAIWETASHGKPLVLIPLTFSAGGHQLKNAEELFSKNCVEIIKERDFNIQSFKDKLLQLKQDEKKRGQMAKSLKACHREDGAQRIADWIFSQLA